MDGHMGSQARVTQRGLGHQCTFPCDMHPLASMRLFRPHPAGVDGCPSSEASCFGPHGQCLAKLEFGYRPRSLYSAHDLQLREEGDTQAGAFMCPASSTGLAWRGILGFCWALWEGVAQTSSCSGCRKPLGPRRWALETYGYPQNGVENRGCKFAAPG